jgi:hypothetical protein
MRIHNLSETTLLFLSLILFASNSTRAGLEGATVEAQRIYDGTIYYDQTATVNGGIEFAGIAGGEANAKITDSQIILDAVASGSYASGSFNGYAFTFTGAPPITNAVLDSSTTWFPAHLTFTSKSVSLDYSGITVPAFPATVVDVAVPEPAALLTLATAIAGISPRRRPFRMTRSEATERTKKNQCEKY